MAENTPEMTKERAKKILKGFDLSPDGSFSKCAKVLEVDGAAFWYAKDSHAKLEGYFTADQLDALAWWMRQHGTPAKKSKS